MPTSKKWIGQSFTMALCVATITACTQHKSYYTECPDAGCKAPFVKPYLAQHGNYDLAFVEFTERGNLFDRAQMEGVLGHVKDHAEKGATVVVFVHGWKNNADPENENLKDFKNALSKASKSQAVRNTVAVGMNLWTRRSPKYFVDP